jgi:hypothetical protein
MIRRIFTTCLFAMALFGLTTVLWGQATTSLNGTVTDKSGAIVPNAKVTLQNTATNQTRETTSTSKGTYELVSVLPGMYKLTVQAKGFRTYIQPEVQLQVNLPATANVQLQVGATTETIEVTGEGAQLNTQDASLGHTMGSVAIEQLPLRAENVPLLLSFQPGVEYNGDKILTDSYDTRAGSVNGERGDQNNITLDGVSINDEFSGYAFTGVLPSTQYSVQEFRVTTSNYDATEGRSAGAQISMVTKGGTNNFHGNLYEFNRNTIGEANDFFLKSSQLANGQANVPEKLVYNIFGGSIGGPIIKNRLFFFFNYQGKRQAYSQSVQRTIPSATLREGIIQYACEDTSSCPGGSVLGADGKSYPVTPGYYALGPTQLAQLDPLHLGPNTAALQYFNSFPEPNTPGGTDAPNYAGYRFAAPTYQDLEWYIGRIDYNLTANGNHTLFFRAAARDDKSKDTPFLPGSAPLDTSVDLSKGFVVGYTATITPHIVNNFRYGLTHQSIGTNGDTSQPWVQMRDLDQGIVYGSGSTAPVHNFADTLSWQKGSHNLQFGTNTLLIRRNSSNYGTSFSDALLNSDWLSYGGFANKNDPLNPPAGGYPQVSSLFTTSYDFPLAAMMGIASELDATYNYKVTGLTTASSIPLGQPLVRHWATDTYSIFAQDTWQMRHNLTVSYGLNYQLMTPITETSGQEVDPNINMGTWFNQRATNAFQGIGENADPNISFQPAGSAWNRSGLYSTQKKNFGPRIGIAWSPEPSWGWLKSLTGDHQTVVRAGFGMYYDNFGPALALSYDATGEFGLSTQVSNPASVLTLQTAPRISGMNNIPTTNSLGQTIFPAAPPAGFPTEFPTDYEAIAHGIDQNMKTPYSYAVNFSIERQLPGKMVLDVAYVGHFAHRLLGYDDIATPLNLRDPKSGVDYFGAASRFSQMWRAYCAKDPSCGQPGHEPTVTAASIGSTAAYWQDMMKQAPGSSFTMGCSGSGGNTNLLQAAFDAFGPGCGSLYNETSGLYDIDLFGQNGLEPVGGFNSYYSGQYSSLWAWRSIGHSNYNGLQVSLKKDFSHGVLFDLNYTYSKSMDIGSEAERGIHYLTDSIMNAWDPNQMYAPSDFDLRHQINGYWIAELPFGHGKAFGGGMNGWQNAVVGGWQLGGTVRWTSGFPFSAFQGYVWPTNWDEMGWADTTGQPINTGRTIINGVPYAFSNPTTAVNAFTYAYPGESGSRNNIRGDGYMSIDMNLAKTWHIPRTEHQTFQFRWNVYNITNTTRFDIYGMQDEVTSSGFGQYLSTLSNPRVMEFSGVYSF